MKKDILFSGIQPSGQLNIAHYIGAMKHWVTFQNKYTSLFCLVDLHTITVLQDPEELRKRCFESLALYIACGINHDESILFVQSHVSQHAELAWVLNCFTGVGELQRMTQYKDKSTQHKYNANAGLFCYPALMAADILLYNTAIVPVGEDQKQHIELARNIAGRFNHNYGEVFKIPEPFIPPAGARIMSLQDPTKKMSKSDPVAGSYVALMDDPAVVTKKFKRAVTDSGSDVSFDPVNKAGISNLLTIYSALTDESIDTICEKYVGKGYGHFKGDLAEIVVEFLKPIQATYNELMQDQSHLVSILHKGADAARERAAKMLKTVYNKLGFIV